jgi:16S rRNA (guanine527-N7)-methyltransferase
MLSSQDIDVFRRVCSSFGIDLSEKMASKFKAYTSLLLEWNQRMHLVSKRDAEPYRILRHFVDSLSIFKAIDIPKGAKFLDLGSGAGFPGVPIKVVRDDIHLTLVESIHKKTLFLQKLAESLGLHEIKIANQRAEELADHEGFRENFDLATAKAAGPLRSVIPLSMPFLRIGGLLVAYKGKGAREEIAETDLLQQCRVREVARIASPDMDLLRWLVLIEKNPREGLPRLIVP